MSAPVSRFWFITSAGSALLVPATPRIWAMGSTALMRGPKSYWTVVPYVNTPLLQILVFPPTLLKTAREILASEYKPLPFCGWIDNV